MKSKHMRAIRCGASARLGKAVVVLALLAFVSAGDVAAQGYGEQRSLPYRIHGYDRTTQEVYRRQFSNAASAASGTSAASGLNSSLSPLKTQTSTSMNNVVQYYDYRNTSVTLNGSNSNVSTGGVLNAGQTSGETAQILNNQSDASAGGANTLPRAIR